MAPTVVGSGTQTATIGTEHTLFTQSAAKTCILHVDRSALALGEVVTINIYDRMLSGDASPVPGTSLPMWSSSYPGGAAEGPIQSPAVCVAYEALFTIKQINGTGRGIKWRVETLD